MGIPFVYDAIFDLSVVKGSTITNVSNGEVAMLLAEDGTGQAPVDHITQKYAIQHGETWVDYRLQARPITLEFIIVGDDDSEIRAKRRKMVGLMSHEPFSLRWTSGIVSRQIDCVYDDAMTFPTKGEEGNAVRFEVRVKALDPLFYDPTTYQAGIARAYGGSGMTFPLVIPFEMGGTTLDSVFSVDNSEDDFFIAEPIITCTGPLTNLKITNKTTGDIIQLTTTIANAEVVTIDTRWGKKTIKNASGTSYMNYLSSTSSLSTFRFVRGVNDIRCEATGVSSSASVLFAYQKKFLSV